MNLNIAIDLLLALISRAQEVSLLISNAKAEGRESLNSAEVNALSAQADAARENLEAAIDRAESEGR